MPNKEEHQLAGGVIGGILVALILMLTTKDTTLLDKILISMNVLICILGAMMPDILEPTNRKYYYYNFYHVTNNHRQLFHTWEVLLVSFFVFILFIAISYIFLTIKVIIFFVIPMYPAFFFLGYGIHLAQDSRTKSNLPIIFSSTKKILKEIGII